MQFFGLADQLLAEIRVCHADQSLSLFPGGQTLQVHAAVLGAQVVHVGTGVGNNAAVLQRRTDAALQLAGIWALDTWVKPFFSRYKKTLVASLGLGVLTLLFAVMLMFVSGFLISYASLPPELGLLSLYIPIGFVQVFGLGKPFFGYFERLASHDWVLRMTSTLREQLYRVLEADGIAGSKIMESGEALGLLSEDIAHVQNLYLRTVFPLVIAWLTGGIVVLAIGAMSAPGEWPLSLFTCTLDSQNRVTVRCEYSEEDAFPSSGG